MIKQISMKLFGHQHCRKCAPTIVVNVTGQQGGTREELAKTVITAIRHAGQLPKNVLTSL